MKRLILCVALVIAGTTACTTASAQFGGLKLPGIGNLQETITKGMGIAKNANDAFREPDEAEEARIGREFGAMLLGAKPLAADPAMQKYVNTLGRWLALQTERPDLQWTFAVLEDPGFNAFATPGGNVFVTTGLVQKMRNESELAGVLAHEIAHVIAKHHLRAVQKRGMLALAGDVTANIKMTGNEMVRSAVVDVAKKLYTSGLDQGDEFEADRLAVTIAARAGYDSYGLPAVLQTLDAQKRSGTDLSLLFRTHPAPEARLAMLEKVMAQGQLDNIPALVGPGVSQRLQEFKR